MNVVCELTKEVDTAFLKVKQRPDSCLVLCCDKASREVRIEAELNNASVDDIRGLLQDQEPRFVIFHFTLKKDEQHKEGHSTSSMLWIHWSPSTPQVSTTRMYAATKERIRPNLDGIREVMISSLEELTQEWIQKKTAYLN